MRKTGAVRAIAWMLALACFLLFCTYVHASFAVGDHDCSGVRCSLCLCSRLKAVAGTFLAVVAMACMLDLPRLFMGRASADIHSFATEDSLVRLKVKLSD